MGSDPTKIRVLVIDNNDLIRAGFIALLNHEKDIVIVGEAKSGADACESLKSLSPDVVLLDINMPGLEGIEATAMISREYPTVKVLAVTHLDHEEYMRKIMSSGARGCISKSCTAEVLRQAIRTVHAGTVVFSSSTTGGPPGTPSQPPVPLTPRERQVLQIVVSGFTSEEISEQLGISVRTVEFHRAHIKKKTGARDAISLVRWALRNNIITLDSDPEERH